jgi:two-component system KDP operon response regulator KdpE
MPPSSLQSRLSKLPVGAQLIVLIDDSAPIRFALGELLSKSGYGVVDAANGHDGLAIIDELAQLNRAPAAVIADLVMDDLPGYDVIKRAKRAFPRMPVIAISGGTRNVPPDLPLDLAKRSGADLCLSKPFGNDEFLDNIGRLIANATRDTRAGA